jgi:cholesterol oxidase
VFFGPENTKAPGVEVEDPFFGGVGPRRRGCLEVGECMSGCRHNAKNTLVKNYLYLAERAGAQIHALTTVIAVRPLDGGYAVDTVRTGSWRAKKTAKTITAEQVIFAAGTWGTQQLLHRMKVDNILPGLSDRLGELTRTNSEAICTASVKLRHRKDADFTQGVAITSSIHPDDKTHIEPVRYGKGSTSMGLLTTVMTDGGGKVPRWVKWLGQVLRHPAQAASLYVGLRDWSQRTVIALVMQTEDNSLTLFPKRTRFGRVKLSSRQGHGVPNPTWIPAGNEAARRLAREIDGAPYSSIGEIFDIPMTAHFLGGCVIGDSAQRGVIDPYHRVFGHPGLHVFDGAAISANIGVNPSLTITAQAERACAFWPNKSEPDTRQPLGVAYQRIAPVQPKNPVVPADAPAALRLE